MTLDFPHEAHVQSSPAPRWTNHPMVQVDWYTHAAPPSLDHSVHERLARSRFSITQWSRALSLGSGTPECSRVAVNENLWRSRPTARRALAGEVRASTILGRRLCGTMGR
eukprot:4976815-Pyramimonas_sp.AAC.1